MESSLLRTGNLLFRRLANNGVFVRHSSTVPQILFEHSLNSANFKEEEAKRREEAASRVKDSLDKVPTLQYGVVTQIPHQIKNICYEIARDAIDKGGFKAVLDHENIRLRGIALLKELQMLRKAGNVNADKMLSEFERFAQGKSSAVLILDQMPLMNFTDEEFKRLGEISVASNVESSPTIKVDNRIVPDQETARAAAKHLSNFFFSFASLYATGHGLPKVGLGSSSPLYCFRRVDKENLHRGGAGDDSDKKGGLSLCGIDAKGVVKTVVVGVEQIVSLLSERELEMLQRPVFYVANRLYNFAEDGTKTFPALDRNSDGQWNFRYFEGLLVSNFKGLSEEDRIELALLIEKINYMAESLVLEGRVLEYGIRTGDSLFVDARHPLARLEEDFGRQSKFSENAAGILFPNSNSGADKAGKDGKDKLLDRSGAPRRVAMSVTSVREEEVGAKVSGPRAKSLGISGNRRQW